MDLSDDTQCYRRRVPLNDPLQPPEQAMFRYVEENMDGDDDREIARLEAWSDGLLKVWVRNE